MHDAKISDALIAAQNVLDRNDRGEYTQPAADLYPHQWLWDSCFTAIGLRHSNTARAQLELSSLLRGQWSNGMLPNIIFRNDLQYRADRYVWSSWLNPHAPNNIATTGITQPPMLAEAVHRIGLTLDAPEQRQWYRQMFPALVKYHTWLYEDRDPHKEGLVLQIHPWETGLDNTPPWMHELHDHKLSWWVSGVQKFGFSPVVNLLRRDTKAVSSDQRFSAVEALALYDAQRRLKRKSYDIDSILDHGLFAIEDVTFNSIFIRANQLLIDMAQTINTELPESLLTSMYTSAAALEQLWDAATSQYYSRDFVTHNLLQEPSIGTLLPLYSGAVSEERAAQLVALLEDDKMFGSTYPVPSVPISSSDFNPQLYWQGPTWINMNWLIVDGLERYGYSDHASALRDGTIDLVTNAGFYEYFNPLDGSPAGGKDFSWTAALFTDLVHQTTG